MTLNQVMASSVCFWSSLVLTLINSLGVLVGKKHHRLCPEMRAFQAEVPDVKCKKEIKISLMD